MCVTDIRSRRTCRSSSHLSLPTRTRFPLDRARGSGGMFTTADWTQPQVGGLLSEVRLLAHALSTHRAWALSQ